MAAVVQNSRAGSRARYGAPRAEVEAALTAKLFPAKESPSAPTPVRKVAETKDSEVQKPTVSEDENQVVPLPEQPTKPIEVPHETPVIRDLGRGGAQHKAIQQRIKTVAEKQGFRCIIEHPVLEGAGSVDVWLQRGSDTIACEVSLTTAIDHEVGNVLKCLKAGCQKIAVICIEDDRLRRIEAGVRASVDGEVASLVAYFQPDRFISYLQELPREVAADAETVSKGYKIKRVRSGASAASAKERETAAIRVIASAMRKK